MKAPRLRQLASNFTSVELPNGTELFFSYETCVAISPCRDRAVRIAGPTKTSAKHITQAGLKEWPVVSQTEFDAYVERAVAA